MRAAWGHLLARGWEPRTPANTGQPRGGLRGTCLCNLVPLLLTLSPAQAPASPGMPDLLQNTSGRQVCFSGGIAGDLRGRTPSLSRPPEVIAPLERPALLGQVPSRHCCDASFAERAWRALECKSDGVMTSRDRHPYRESETQNCVSLAKVPATGYRRWKPVLPNACHSPLSSAVRGSLSEQPPRAGCGPRGQLWGKLGFLTLPHSPRQWGKMVRA